MSVEDLDHPGIARLDLTPCSRCAGSPCPGCHSVCGSWAGPALGWVLLTQPMIFPRGSHPRTLTGWLGCFQGNLSWMLSLPGAVAAWKVWRIAPLPAGSVASELKEKGFIHRPRRARPGSRSRSSSPRRCRNTIELGDAGDPALPHWQLTSPARLRSSDLVLLRDPFTLRATLPRLSCIEPTLRNRPAAWHPALPVSRCV